MAVNLSAITGVLTDIASTPGAFNLFRNHLSASGEMQAVSILDAMTPASAPAMLGALMAIQGLPPQVMTFVNAAISDPTAFQANMTQAKAALVASNASSLSGLLGNL